MEENNVLDKGTVDRPGEKPAAITDRIEAESCLLYTSDAADE